MSIEQIKERHEDIEATINWHGHSNVGETAHKDRGELLDTLAAVKSIRQEYANLIAQDRGLIGADTVLDMIDAALAMGEK